MLRKYWNETRSCPTWMTEQVSRRMEGGTNDLPSTRHSMKMCRAKAVFNSGHLLHHVDHGFCFKPLNCFGLKTVIWKRLASGWLEGHVSFLIIFGSQKLKTQGLLHLKVFTCPASCMEVYCGRCSSDLGRKAPNIMEKSLCLCVGCPQVFPCLFPLDTRP